MPLEIERKFLLGSDAWRSEVVSESILRQGYMANNEHCSVRIRISDGKGNINIKSMTVGIARQEYEYAIPIAEANEMLDKLCQPPLIEKTRYHVNHAGKLWEIDVFEGDNEGLVVAEVELEDENEAIELPEWVGKEVSSLERYYNMRLTRYPWSQWTEAERQAEDVS